MTLRPAALPLLLLAAGCIHFPPPAPPPLSGDAANFFAHADSEDNAGSLVIDIDELRAQGFLNPPPPGEHSIWSDIVAYTLPTVAGELHNRPEGVLLARIAVLFAIFREWDGWPRIQRVGVLLPAESSKTDGPASNATGLDLSPDLLVMMIALEGGTDMSQTLLNALAAADRAAGPPALTAVDGSLCLRADEQGLRWCIRAGPGFLAVGTPAALARLPVYLSPEKTKPPSRAIARLRLNLPAFGKGYAVLEPLKGVRFRAAFASPRVDVAALVEQRLLEVLGQLQARHEAQTALIGPVLAEIKAGMAKDPYAPPGIKSAADHLTLNQLLDPEGTWAAIRESIHVERKENLVTAEATIPEQAVRKAAEGGTGFLTFAAVGVLSSLAIPTFVKYQCESKQAEATQALTSAAALAHDVYEHGRTVTNLASLGFTAPENSRYNYCLGDECVPCKAGKCFVPPPESNPCLRLGKSDMARTKYRFLMCAVSDLNGSNPPGDLDVWVVTDDGMPRHLQDACN